MEYLKLTLKAGREKSLIFKHPWIFSGAIEKKSLSAGIEDGSIVDLVDQKGNFLGRGYYNSKSNIAVRVLTFKQKEKIDQAFIHQKIQEALLRRKSYVNEKKTNAFRVVFAEGDSLPGLIVDKYGEYLVLQIHTLGMEQFKTMVVEALIEIFKPKGIFERSDVSVRKKDGLDTMPKGLLYGKLPKSNLQIQENGLKFLVDFQDGQKTGFFLDQRENRQALQKYVEGKKVLNLFSYSGGFSCYALAFGAQHVTSVDISQDAVELCNKNIQLNGFVPEQHTEVTEDVFSYLERAIENKEKFDVVIVDPPAFVKNQKKLNNAINAYIKLNEAALKVLTNQGILVSSSCSSFVTQAMFRSVLFQAGLRSSQNAPTDLLLLENKLQPFDHPLRINFPEGEYLKFFILQKN